MIAYTEEELTVTVLKNYRAFSLQETTL